MKRKLLLATLTASIVLSGCSNTLVTPEIAKHNQAASEYNLANNYYYGDGVIQNYSKAVDLYRKSAELS
ncbi:TPR repeat protein [Moritella viscosa]|uniref:SEL1-like repeat protein n=1 Tax=Moritella viscosa TaxID=80854 RepID=UPI0005D41241|nr:SEL1-like repeat protein [Moritella viscosa]SHO00845.1 TPR repeat protein [Moritella viscosa]SHO20369.1 TPR repeat protein [Moritella viscosa]